MPVVITTQPANTSSAPIELGLGETRRSCRRLCHRQGGLDRTPANVMVVIRRSRSDFSCPGESSGRRRGLDPPSRAASQGEPGPAQLAQDSPAPDNSLVSPAMTQQATPSSTKPATVRNGRQKRRHWRLLGHPIWHLRASGRHSPGTWTERANPARALCRQWGCSRRGGSPGRGRARRMQGVRPSAGARGRPMGGAHRVQHFAVRPARGQFGHRRSVPGRNGREAHQG